MVQYIDKADLVAEIERRISNHNKELRHATDEDFVSSWASDEENQKLALTALIPFINTLEVKEVDLEKAIDGFTAGWIEGEEYGELQNINTCRCVTLGEVKEAMRCMFELGIKAAQKGE